MPDDSLEKASARAFDKAGFRPRTRPPPILYHYTTCAAFEAIIRSGGLYATHVRYLADPAEIIYGRKLLHEVLSAEAASLGAEAVDELEKYLLLSAQSSPDSLTPVYVTCLSARDDDIAQWERYADGGRGYAVGFDSEALGVGMQRRGGVGITDRAILRPVVYDRKEQLSSLAKVVRIAVKLLEKHRAEYDADRNAALSALTHYMAWHILDRLACFKQDGYKAEEEWRLVVSDGPHMHKDLSDASFRSGARGLVPYLVLVPHEPEAQGPLPIRSVRTGPRLAEIEAPPAAMGFLRQNGYKPYPAQSIEEFRRFLKDRFTKEPVSVQASTLLR